MNNVTSLTGLLSLCISGSGRISPILLSCLRFFHCCLWLLGQRPLESGPGADFLLRQRRSKNSKTPWP
jgi:hypothetical protein